MLIITILSMLNIRFVWLAFLGVAFSLLSLGAALAETATASWDSNPEPDITHYHLKYGTATGGPYPNTINVTAPNTSATVQGLQPGRPYFFVVTAFNSVGESPSSQEKSYTVPNPTPTPSPTPTATPTPTPTPLPTATPVPTATPIPTATPAPSAPPQISPTPSPSPSPIGLSHSLANVSTRVQVKSGDSVLIGGFIISGDKSKNVIMRAIGPSLTAAGVRGALKDPVLELYDSTGTLIQKNDNCTSLRAGLVPKGLEPANGAESVINTSLAPGSYTAVLRGVKGGTGVGLFELYDLDPANSRVSNISTRGNVETGDGAMIAGFIIGGSDPTKVIIRAIGPSLSANGVTGALRDPVLELHDADGSLIFSNDNWRSDQEKQIIDSTVPPTNNKESAIVATLNPGNYTAIVRGVGGTSGVALVEVYNLDSH